MSRGSVKQFIDFITVTAAKEVNLVQQLGRYQHTLHDTHGYSTTKAYQAMAEAARESLVDLRRSALRILLWQTDNLDPRTMTKYV